MDLQLSRRIASLLVRERQGELTDTERKELEAWIDRTEDNKALYLRLTNDDYLKETLATYIVRHGDNERWWTNVGLIRKTRRRRRTMWTAVSASAVAVVVVILALILPDRAGDGRVLPGQANALLTLSDGRQVELAPEHQDLEWMKYIGEDSSSDTDDTTPTLTISIPRGGEYRLELPDGTRVWLNSETVFNYPGRFGDELRSVSLAGEAYFEVAHNETVPFVVSTPKDVSVKVLGTSFNLSAYQSDSLTIATLVSGKVEISTPSSRLELEPDRQAVVDEWGDIVIADVNSALYVAWIGGVFEFDNMTLCDITRQLSRWYDVEFVFKDDVGRERFTGGIWKDIPLDDFLGNIEALNAVSFSRRGNTVEVSKK